MVKKVQSTIQKVSESKFASLFVASMFTFLFGLISWAAIQLYNFNGKFSVLIDNTSDNKADIAQLRTQVSECSRRDYAAFDTIKTVEWRIMSLINRKVNRWHSGRR